MSKFFASHAVLIAGLIAASPALAFTHHPATPAEKAQTRDLNLQQLAIIQGHAPGDMQANTSAPTTDQSAPATNAPADQAAPAAAPNAPAAPQNSAQPAPQTDQAPAPQPQTPQQ
jgi:hypothetical protein